jgi:hypothetical protein
MHCFSIVSNGINILLHFHGIANDASIASLKSGVLALSLCLAALLLGIRDAVSSEVHTLIRSSALDWSKHGGVRDYVSGFDDTSSFKYRGTCIRGL